MSTKKKIKAPYLDIDIYHSRLYLFFTGDAAREVDGSNGYNYERNGATAFIFPDKYSGCFGIQILKYDDLDCTHSTKSKYIAALAHEALHIVAFIYKHIGEDYPGSEQSNYLLEYIVEWLIRETKILEI